MKFLDQQKLVNNLYRLLKIEGIAFPIGRTPKGDLSIVYTKDGEGFHITLDSVPLNEKDSDNKELKAILTKYLYEPPID